MCWYFLLLLLYVYYFIYYYVCYINNTRSSHGVFILLPKITRNFLSFLVYRCTIKFINYNKLNLYPQLCLASNSLIFHPISVFLNLLFPNATNHFIYCIRLYALATDYSKVLINHHTILYVWPFLSFPFIAGQGRDD